MDFQITEFKTLFDLLKKFDSEQVCIDHLEVIRWDGKVVSPFDENSSVYKCKGNKYKCRNTNKYFNVRTGTIFDDSKIPLQKWFMAIYIMSSHKKGISSYQLGKDIGITQKSAWFLLHRIRYAFDHPNFKLEMQGDIEADETYYGGKYKNKHNKDKKEGAQGRSGIDKTPIFGLTQREGNVMAQVVTDTKRETIQPIIMQHVQKGSILHTDEWHAYRGLGHIFQHKIVNHAAKEYVSGNSHVNSMEGFWGLFKMGTIGIYHHLSPKHLQCYIDEYTYRYNTRDMKEATRFNSYLSQTTDRRLTYKKLIQK